MVMVHKYVFMTIGYVLLSYIVGNRYITFHTVIIITVLNIITGTWATLQPTTPLDPTIILNTL